MEMILNSIPNLSFHQRIRDDDQVDQLHNYVTVYLLIISGLIVGVKELTGNPLDCWVTIEKYGQYQKHVNSYCWAHKLYRYPNMQNLTQMPKLVTNDEGNGVEGEDDATILNSYKWVTVIFILQAVLFKIPDMMWSECNAESGTKIEQVVTMLKDSTLKLQEERKANLNIVAEFLELWLKLNGRRENLTSGAEDKLSCCYEVKGNKRNRFLSNMYMVIKFCYLFNLLMQFVLLTLFLEFSFWNYGTHLMSSDGLTSQDYFPLTGLCHFEVKGDSEWVQCILLMNMLVEKILMVQWLWFLVLLVITILNIVSWIPRIFRQETALRFIRWYLRILCKEFDNKKAGRGSVRHFVCHYLGQDGVFVLRILSINTSSVTMAELMQCLWYRYQDDQNRRLSKTTGIDEEEEVQGHGRTFGKVKEIELERLNDDTQA